MIVETGHFALILAFALALAQAVIPFAGARLGDGALMRVARPTALMQFLSRRARLWGADLCACRLGFLARQRHRELPFAASR